MEDNNINNEQPKKKSNIGVIVFLIILVLGLAGYICYDKFYKKESADTKKNSNQQEETKEEMKESSLSTLELENIIKERIPRDLCHEDSDLYQESGFDINQVKNLYFDLSLEIGKKLNNKDEIVLSIDEINKMYKEILLNSPTITLKDIQSSSYDGNWGILKYTVIDDEHIKFEPYIMGCDDYELFMKKIINAKENDKKLEINVKVAFIEGNESPTIYSKKASDVTKYPDMQYEDHVVETFNIEGRELQLSDLNWDLYDTYKLTFTKENGAYYLDSVSLVK